MPPGFLNRNIILPTVLTPRAESDAADRGIVPLEPDFPADRRVSFEEPIRDDGRIDNRLSRLFGARRTASMPAPAASTLQARSRSAIPVRVPTELCFFRVDIPPEFKFQAAQMEQLLGSLINSLDLVSFEIVANGSEFSFQFAAAEAEREVLGRQLRAHIPEFDIRSSADGLAAADLTATARSLVIPFGLADHWFLPITKAQDLGVDPLIPLAAALDGVGSGEIVCLQTIFARTRRP